MSVAREEKGQGLDLGVLYLEILKMEPTKEAEQEQVCMIGEKRENSVPEPN